MPRIYRVILALFVVCAFSAPAAAITTSADGNITEISDQHYLFLTEEIKLKQPVVLKKFQNADFLVSLIGIIGPYLVRVGATGNESMHIEVNGFRIETYSATLQFMRGNPYNDARFISMGTASPSPLLPGIIDKPVDLRPSDLLGEGSIDMTSFRLVLLNLSERDMKIDSFRIGVDSDSVKIIETPLPGAALLAFSALLLLPAFCLRQRSPGRA